MKYLYHVTLQTGHMRKSLRSEVDSELMNQLNEIFEKSVDKPTTLEFNPTYSVRSTAATEGYFITLKGNKKGKQIPILTLGVSLDSYVPWDLLHDPNTLSLPIKTKREDKPPLPYLADRLEVGAAYFYEALSWTGDFSRCMAWAALEGNRSTKKRRSK